jgi:hypothetical protein
MIPALGIAKPVSDLLLLMVNCVRTFFHPFEARSTCMKQSMMLLYKIMQVESTILASVQYKKLPAFHAMDHCSCIFPISTLFLS